MTAGVFAKRGDVQDIIRMMGRQEDWILKQAPRIVADTVERLIDDGFEKSRDPERRKWKKRKHRVPWKKLVKTGELRASFTSKAVQRTVLVRVGVQKFFFHQFGTRTIAARPMVPTSALPVPWEREIDRELKASQAALKSEFRSGHIG